MPEPPDDDRMPRHDEIFGAGREAHAEWRAFWIADCRMTSLEERRLRWRECLLSPSVFLRFQAHHAWICTLRHVPDHPVLGRQVSLDNGVLEIVRSEQDPPFDVIGLLIRILLGDETGLMEVRSQLQTATGERRRALEQCLERSAPPQAPGDFGSSTIFYPIPTYDRPPPPKPSRPPHPRIAPLRDLTAFRLPLFAEHSKVLGEHPKVIELLKSPGDSIDNGETILELETDRALIEVPIPFEWRLHKWAVRVGDEVESGTLLCWILKPSTDDQGA